MASLLFNEESKEVKDSIIMPMVEVQRKTFDMRTIIAGKNLEASFKKESSLEDKASIVPYTSAINYIRVNPNFMLKEELLKTKVFPIREWLVTKNKTISQEVEQENTNTFHMWKWILVVIIFVVLCIVTAIFFAIEDHN